MGGGAVEEAEAGLSELAIERSMTVLPSPTSADPKSKTLATHWIGRYKVEKNLKSNEDIDPVDFSIWLQNKEAPSLGQKRNIAAAIKNHLGIKLLAICDNGPQEKDCISPSLDTFNKTLSVINNIYEIKRNGECDDYLLYGQAYFSFLVTSITGLSIMEISRLKIVDSKAKYPDRNNDENKMYDLKISVEPSIDGKMPDRKNKYIDLVNLTEKHRNYTENIPKLLSLNGDNSFSQTVSKIQYIIAKHNVAKGCSLRQLRSVYPKILGYIKSYE